MLERLRACATCARLSTLARAYMLQRSARVLESGMGPDVNFVALAR